MGIGSRTCVGGLLRRRATMARRCGVAIGSLRTALDDDQFGVNEGGMTERGGWRRADADRSSST